MVTSRRGPDPVGPDSLGPAQVGPAQVGPARVAVEVEATCDNRCLFCCREGISEAPSSPLRERLRAARAHAEEVTLVGGEPTLLGDALVEAVCEARALGFRRVGLQSHGRHLGEADPGALLEALVEAGLSDLQLSIHGDRAEVHDHHVGIDGAWAQVEKTLAALRGRGLRIAAVTVITRSNFRNLRPLPQWLQARGIDAWGIVVPRAVGGARRHFERVVPRLGMALPHALRALDAGRRRRLPSWIIGAPECLLGPYRRWSLAATEAGSYASRCDGCPAQGACAGIDPIYSARFGDGELSPARLVAPGSEAREDRREAELRRLFVGMGRVVSGGRALATIIEPPRSGAARQGSALS